MWTQLSRQMQQMFVMQDLNIPIDMQIMLSWYCKVDRLVNSDIICIFIHGK
jgi:hypothetical protein